jgi:SAM-dependent methyltransferase
MRQLAVPCFVCGSDKESEFLTIRRTTSDASAGEYRLARCTACNFLYINPRPTPDALTALYATHVAYFREDYEPISRELPVLRRVLADITRFVPGGTLLEVGCGRGELLELALKAGFQVDGCDLQRSSAANSRINVHIGTLGSADFADQSFDCIVLRNTLEHLFDPTEEIARCHLLLKKSGILYLKVPNADYEHGWRCRLMFQKSNVFGPPWHLNYFTQASLARFLFRSGFRVAEWLIEQPTKDLRPMHDVIQQSLFGSFRFVRALSFGRVFPKPLLTCIARKVSLNVTDIDNPKV